LIITFLYCDNEKKKQDEKGFLGPITHFLIRLVNSEGNWIEGIEEKEMKLLIADREWNILDLI